MQFRPIFAATIAALITAAAAAPAQPSDDTEALDCSVKYELVARASDAGYDHLVHIRNACDFMLGCSLRSESGESDVALSAKQTRAIVVAEGEDDQDFQANLQCFPLGDA